jgi:hypothetical protein
VSSRVIFAGLAIGGMAAMAMMHALPARAGEVDVQLFGVDPGEARAAACFIRHYDPAHLSAHPQQNVTDMLLLVDSNVDADGRSYMASLAVNFRGLGTQMQVSGYCGSVQSGEQVLGCGIDCDGGTIGVRLRDADTVLVDIPDGARTWDPTAPLDAEPRDTPAEAAFGADDQTFKLSRTGLSQCEVLAYDDELKAIVTKGE